MLSRSFFLDIFSVLKPSSFLMSLSISLICFCSACLAMSSSSSSSLTERSHRSTLAANHQIQLHFWRCREMELAYSACFGISQIPAGLEFDSSGFQIPGASWLAPAESCKQKPKEKGKCSWIRSNKAMGGASVPYNTAAR